MIIKNSCLINFEINGDKFKNKSNDIKVNKINPFVNVNVGFNHITINNNSNTTIYNFKYYHKGKLYYDNSKIIAGDTIAINNENISSEDSYVIYDFYENGIKSTMYVFDISLLGKIIN